jgi:Tol biopolymer transport system component
MLMATGLMAGHEGEAGTTSRVSVSAEGDSLPSQGPAISADGRYVVFWSVSDTLVLHDTNGRGDVFIHDRWTDVTERLSVASDGTQANGSSQSDAGAISPDGGFVAFVSRASNLVPGDTNLEYDVFVRDRRRLKTSRVSVATDGAQANGPSFEAAISARGRFVAFHSVATNLVAGDTNGWVDVFVHDRLTRTTERVSVASDGTQGNGRSYGAAISTDGRFVAFTSQASNLVADDDNGEADAFVHDRVTGITERVSVSSQGAEGTGYSTLTSMSGDGRFVCFRSLASNLVPGDTNGTSDVFVHDRQTGNTERVSVASNGFQLDTYSQQSAVSADGRFVAFVSLFLPHGQDEVFVHDRETGITERVSVTSDGQQGHGGSWSPVISANGRIVAFDSSANLVSGATNGGVYVRDRGPGSDLVMVAVSDPPAEGQRKSKFLVSDTVRNLGGIGSDESMTGYYLSADKQRSGAATRLKGTRSVSELVAGGTSAGSVTVTVPLTTPFGTYYLLACADDTDAVPEDDEDNNCLPSSSTMVVGVPDLVEMRVSEPPARVGPRGTFVVRDVVQNRGSVTAGDAVVRYYLSRDRAKNGTDGYLVGSRVVPKLAPGASSSDAITVTVSPVPPFGAYYLLACVDGTPTRDANIGNNCAASTGTVMIRPPWTL